MIRSSSSRGFTLIEMLTVMLIIAVLAGIVLSVNGLVQSKAARARAEGEIKALSLAAESYRADNGAYPRSERTDALDPRRDFNATSTPYQNANRDLYAALSGDTNFNGRFDTDEGKSYASDFFKPNVLNATRDGSGNITRVNFLKDPFDNAYGYSTAAALAEEEFLERLRRDRNATRPEQTPGYNPTFDLWSTGGVVAGNVQAKWVKNW